MRFHPIKPTYQESPSLKRKWKIKQFWNNITKVIVLQPLYEDAVYVKKENCAHLSHLWHFSLILACYDLHCVPLLNMHLDTNGFAICIQRLFDPPLGLQCHELPKKESHDHVTIQQNRNFVGPCPTASLYPAQHQASCSSTWLYILHAANTHEQNTEDHTIIVVGRGVTARACKHNQI